MKKYVTIFLFIISASLLAGGWYMMLHKKAAPEVVPVPAYEPKERKEVKEPTGKVLYGCLEKKSIQAEYTEAVSRDSLSGGSVYLKLSDGREMTFAQTGNRNGSRYANKDQSLVYWRKGNGAFLMEDDAKMTYANCVMVAPPPAGANLPTAYSESAGGFSIRLPAGYIADESYVYQALGPGKDISGVKFTIPASLAKGTNLSDDSYISVEKIPNAKDCSAGMFLEWGVQVRTTTENDTAYSAASSTGAAAGNRYEETVYAFPGTSPCLAVRYFIHYGVFENYAPGLAREFDQGALRRQFDAIRRTLIVNQ
jgi:membrane-bound inhibitor of C-type lysozyme